MYEQTVAAFSPGFQEVLFKIFATIHQEVLIDSRDYISGRPQQILGPSRSYVQSAK